MSPCYGWEKSIVIGIELKLRKRRTENRNRRLNSVVAASSVNHAFNIISQLAAIASSFNVCFCVILLTYVFLYNIKFNNYLIIIIIIKEGTVPQSFYSYLCTANAAMPLSFSLQHSEISPSFDLLLLI